METTEPAGVLLTVAYDGTELSGWARQPDARTAQGVLESAIASMNGAPARVRGTSRTDAGVHARAQRAAFDPDREIPLRGWQLGLNAALPPDVAVVGAEPCARGYEPRFDTIDKTYRYLFLSGEIRDPLLRRRAWWVRRELDVDAMRRAAQGLVGTHDFRAFRSADDTRENTVRTVFAVELDECAEGEPRLLALEIRGTAFMKNMVRIIAGTLVEAGVGRMRAADVAALLGEAGSREDAGPTAPPQGLTLVDVRLGRADRAFAGDGPASAP